MVTGKRVLVTGASGLLGKYLTHTSPPEYNVRGTWFTSMLPSGYVMDITDQGSIDASFYKHQPEFVIHCAAIGSVDYCQRHWQEAFEVNVLGVQKVLKACKDNGSKVVFISTNAVFDGQHPPYAEEDERNPINTYGRHKALAEEAVTEYSGHWLIVRPIMLYGIPYKDGRGNWVTRVMDFMCNGSTLRVVKDVITQPTYAEDVATSIWKMLPSETGIWHIGGADSLTLFDFTLKIADIWQMKSEKSRQLILPARSHQFSDLAPRPRDTTYDMSKLRAYLEKDGTPMPSGVDEGLMRMKRE